jgi:hypothetical protein
MAEEKEKALEKDLTTQPPTGIKKEELSDADFEKVAGGGVLHDEGTGFF